VKYKYHVHVGKVSEVVVCWSMIYYCMRV